MFYRLKCKIYGLLPILVTILLVGCSSSNNYIGNSGGSPILVTVTDQAGNPLPAATVVLGDRNGVMRAHGATDANGQITFNDSPVNATVTAAFSCVLSGSTYTYDSFDIKFDVDVPVTLRLSSCSVSANPSPHSPAAALGTVIVNVTNMIAGLSQNTMQTNQLLPLQGSSLITQQTLTITSFDLQIDGKLSIVVIGKDANGTSIGYGTALDQTFTDGMTVNISVDQPMSLVQYQITNIPPTASNLSISLGQTRTGKGLTFVADFLTFTSAPTSTIVNVPYIPGLGDQFWYGISISSGRDNGDGISISSYQQMGIDGPPSSSAPSNQFFDASQLLTVPSNLTVSGVNTATPTLSWSGLDPRATRYGMVANFRRTSARYLLFGISNLSRTRTSVTFPELPDSLAAFRPTGVYGFSVFLGPDSGEYSRFSEASYTKFLP